MNKEKLATLIPIHELEQSAQQQIYETLKLDFVEKLAIMPDCHTGYTLPIGGVALLNGVISPEYVGYDAGCGVCCILTDIEYTDILKRKKVNQFIFNEIYRRIPVGPNCREKPLHISPRFRSACGDKNLDKKVNNKLLSQKGTLGSGNHFIEIGYDKNNHLGITLHSGSRNPGHSIADFYMKKTRLNDQDLPKGFFWLDSDWGQMYLRDMNYALEYALENRKLMMDELLNILGFSESEKRVLFKGMINENHNHAVLQADNRVLHRKGATESLNNQLGVIPGNMRDGVYIVKGLGNENYLSSSSHGAGRKGSRTWAKKSIPMERFEKSMKGIIAKVGKSTLDESPDAYKNVDDVIKAQEGIVIDVINHIKPVINVKG